MNSPSPNPLALDPQTYSRGLACVHCGLCLPACPTYVLNSNEADSPRGRIQIMLNLSDAKILPTTAAVEHLDRCLDCRACETACPSGVVYHELIEGMRERLHDAGKLPQKTRVTNWMARIFFTKPSRLRKLIAIARVIKSIGLPRIFPSRFSKMFAMLPPRIETQSPVEIPSHGSKPIVYFRGCVGESLNQSIDEKAIALLAACGLAPSIVKNENCCGAIHHHGGDSESARELARKNIEAFQDFDVIVTSIAGCGAMLRDYASLLRDDPCAADFSSRVRDISQMLENLPPLTHRVEKIVAYHDACHLAHAQKITKEPRELLAKIPGIDLRPLAESDMCCGAAGTYNLSHPEIAAALGNRKLDHVAASGANVCAVGNIGCAMHLRGCGAARNISIQHPVELLHEALFGKQSEQD